MENRRKVRIRQRNGLDEKQNVHENNKKKLSESQEAMIDGKMKTNLNLMF